LITLVSVNCERLARDGRLIDVEKGPIGNDAAVSRNDGTLHKGLVSATGTQIRSSRWTYFFDLENVTRDHFMGLNFAETAATKDSGFESKSLLQLIDDGAGLELLYESNGCIQQ
jgi:hypothetical protein